jgi:protein-L-isoaspartate O-methyltransferase
VAFLRNVLINVNSAINQRRWLRAEANRLRAAGDLSALKLAHALEAVLRHDFSAEESDRIRAIEALRRRLLLSFGAVSQSAGGAGSGITVFRAALSSKSAFWAGVLFKLVREFKPGTCLELGTNMGISAAYQASALQLNGGGRLITLEGEDARAMLARRNLGQLGLENVEVVLGQFRDTLPAVLRTNEVVDFAFIDGHHDELATREYFELIKSHLSRPAVVALDDISWSQGMRRAWGVIRRAPRVRVAIDLRVLGVCVVD